MRFLQLLITLCLLSASSANAQFSPSSNRDWFNADQKEDQQAGASVNKAYNRLIAAKAADTIVVAVIDSGVDIEHEDLRNQIWVNKDEIPDNGIDDDNNGYIDDIHGWSFISGPGGEVHYDNLEFTRIYADLKKQFESSEKKDVPREQRDNFERYLSMKEQYTKRIQNAREDLQEFEQLADFYFFAKQQLDQVFDGEPYTIEDVKALDSQDDNALMIRDFMAMAMENDLEPQIDEGLRHFRNAVNYSYNLSLNTREKVGDNPENPYERFYGTNQVKGPRPDHGTHVAGIIGAERNNGMGINGIASAVKIMVLRAVPDGDERDKDVANAIRYAADNGARIINMSFGKSYSPHKLVVDSAMAYAASKGVLMVHAAGNSSRNNDKSNNFPNPVYEETRERCALWIEVGASTPSADSLVAGFTNYGRRSVDIFAPGYDIYSTTPDNTYRSNSGTSMAAPVVSGVAALVWSYYPELEASDIREIITNSFTWYGKMKVQRPGKKPKKVRFRKLSRTGGVVNAYNALKMAEEYRSRQQNGGKGG